MITVVTINVRRFMFIEQIIDLRDLISARENVVSV